MSQSKIDYDHIQEQWEAQHGADLGELWELNKATTPEFDPVVSDLQEIEDLARFLAPWIEYAERKLDTYGQGHKGVAPRIIELVGNIRAKITT